MMHLMHREDLMDIKYGTALAVELTLVVFCQCKGGDCPSFEWLNRPYCRTNTWNGCCTFENGLNTRFWNWKPPRQEVVSAIYAARHYVRYGKRVSAPAGYYEDPVDDALRYIHDNYCHDDISLNTAARAINVSSNYLSTIFSQKVGDSFIEYLTKKRMQRAKQLLRETDKRSGEIALAVGYKDPRYFSYVFKRTQGCTPSEYRNQEMEQDGNLSE